MAGVESDYLREIDRRALRTIWKPYLFAACFIALGMLVLCHGCGLNGMGPSAASEAING